MKDTTKHTTLKDAHYLTVTPDGRKDTHQLAVSYTTGTGAEYRTTDRAQVDIWIAGKPVFNGTFEDLLNKLQYPTAAKYQPGTQVHWSYGVNGRHTVINAETDRDGVIKYTLSDMRGNLSINIPEGEILP